jgi:hypothetical protein
MYNFIIFTIACHLCIYVYDSDACKSYYKVIVYLKMAERPKHVMHV